MAPRTFSSRRSSSEKRTRATTAPSSGSRLRASRPPCSAPSLGEWDPEIVLASVEKSSKVIVLHDNSGNELLAADLAATIGEECFQDLDAPVQRVAVEDGDLASRVRQQAES